MPPFITTCSHCHHTAFDDLEHKIPQHIAERCPKNPTGGCPACQKLAEIERKIERHMADAQLALNHLMRERDSLASTINEHHDPFFCRLPVEVVSYIFTHCRPFLPCLDVFESGSEFDEAEHTMAIFTLGQVCRNWRSIARSTPQLWTIFCPMITQKNCTASITYAQQWLQSSGGLALYIGLHVGSEESISELFHEATYKVVATMSEHSQRFKVLRIQTPASVLLSALSALSKSRLDFLEHIIVDVAIVGDEVDGGQVLHLDASPHTVTWRDGWLKQLSIDWGHLTHFVGYNALTIHECQNLFHNTPLLLFCSLPQISSYRVEEPSTSVESSSVQSLILGSFPYEFSRLFVFPSLSTLCITSETPWDDLEVLLRHSGCNVTNLTVEYTSPTPEKVIAVLDATPDLEQLALDGYGAQESLFLALNDEFSRSGQSSGLLARLKSLNLTTSDYSFDWAWFPPFVGYMKRKSLQSIEFRYEGDYLDDVGYLPLDWFVFDTVLTAAEAIDFRMVDDHGPDLLGRLCYDHLCSV